MSKYSVTINWKKKEDEIYTDNKYSREHEWIFDGGLTVPASASPHVVPLPFSVEANVDPEEAFVASLSGCNMLFFLSIAAKRKFIVDSYVDNTIGLLEEDEYGKLSMTKVILKPKVAFSGNNQPTFEEFEKIHHLSHERCYIANSVKTEVKTGIIT